MIDRIPYEVMEICIIQRLDWDDCLSLLQVNQYFYQYRNNRYVIEYILDNFLYRCWEWREKLKKNINKGVEKWCEISRLLKWDHPYNNFNSRDDGKIKHINHFLDDKFENPPLNAKCIELGYFDHEKKENNPYNPDPKNKFIFVKEFEEYEEYTNDEFERNYTGEPFDPLFQIITPPALPPVDEEETMKQFKKLTLMKIENEKRIQHLESIEDFEKIFSPSYIPRHMTKKSMKECFESVKKNEQFLKRMGYKYDYNIKKTYFDYDCLLDIIQLPIRDVALYNRLIYYCFDENIYFENPDDYYKRNIPGYERDMSIKISLKDVNTKRGILRYKYQMLDTINIWMERLMRLYLETDAGFSLLNERFESEFQDIYVVDESQEDDESSEELYQEYEYYNTDGYYIIEEIDYGNALQYDYS